MATSMRSRGTVVVALLLLGAGCGDAPVVQRGGVGGSRQALTESSLSSVADSFVKSGSPNQAQGSLGYLRIQDSGDNRALVRFDQAAIASAVGSSTLAGAFLELTITDNGNNWSADGRAVDVHRVTNPAWTEPGATWNCAADTNPSNSAADCSGATAWAMAAAGPHPWVATPSDTQVIANGDTGVVSWDVTADVAAFLAGTPNAGWIIKKAEESATGRADFGSRESSSAPRLVLLLVSPGEDAGVGGGPGGPLAPDQDTYVRAGAENSNQGGATILRLQSSGKNRALVSFSQAAIAAAVGSGHLTSATLEFTVAHNGQNWGTTGRAVDLHRVTHDWVERNATWRCSNDTIPTNTSPDCSGPTAWEMGTAGPNPWATTPTATRTITNATAGTITFDVTADVTAFLAGTSTNYGWVLEKTDEGQAGRLELFARETTSPPRLILSITPGDAGVDSGTDAGVDAGT